MTTYNVEAEDLEEIGEDLKALGIVGPSETAWDGMLNTLEQLLDGVRESHERTDGRGNQQSKIAEYARLDDEYSAHRVGKMLDVLGYFDFVEHDDRRYRLGERGEQYFD